MTVGAGIFASTLLLLFALAVYQITIRRKWRVVGKVTAFFVLVAAILGGASWGWYRYSNRPSVATELDGIRLGMGAVDVRLAKGAPSEEGEPERDTDGELSVAWLYGTGDAYSLVIFSGRDTSDLKVSIVCEAGGYSRVLGFGRFDAEASLLNSLGPPTSQSINKEGLAKMVSYQQWKVAYEIAKGQINQVCVTESGRVTFREEYQEQADAAVAPTTAETTTPDPTAVQAPQR
jgi:hypothetical protein